MKERHGSKTRFAVEFHVELNLRICAESPISHIKSFGDKYTSQVRAKGDDLTEIPFFCKHSGICRILLTVLILQIVQLLNISFLGLSGDLLGVLASVILWEWLGARGIDN